MTNDMILAGLIAQANAKGCDVTTLRALVEEASDAGAARALRRVGLNDTSAGKDVEELRALLEAWRGAKRAAVRTAAIWVLRGVLILMLIGAAWMAGVKA
ncbi:MAG: DUF6127 family protein [Pseudomonadota bacterium]